MENYLKETYGIEVYQEQVMQLSQKLADFQRVMQTSEKSDGKKFFFT